MYVQLKDNFFLCTNTNQSVPVIIIKDHARNFKLVKSAIRIPELSIKLFFSQFLCKYYGKYFKFI